jgi:hypothetical protein
MDPDLAREIDELIATAEKYGGTDLAKTIDELIATAEKYPGTAAWLAVVVGLLAIVSTWYFTRSESEAAVNRAANAQIKIILDVAHRFIMDLRVYVHLVLKNEPIRPATVDTKAMKQLAEMQVTRWPSVWAHRFFHDFWEHGTALLNTDISQKGDVERRLIPTEGRYELLEKSLKEAMK